MIAKTFMKKEEMDFYLLILLQNLRAEKHLKQTNWSA